MNFYTTILGSGAALPTVARHCSGQVVNINGFRILLDCGENTQTQLRVYHQRMQAVSQIFITHLHGDHCFGLIGMISTFGLLGRTATLHIHAPQELEPMLLSQIGFFTHDLGYEIEFHPVDTTKNAIVYEDRSVTVETIPLQHRMPTCGYLIREKQGLPHIRREMMDFYQIPTSQVNNIKNGADWTTADGEVVPNARLVKQADPPRSYAYCTDTRYIPTLHELLKGVNTLYHESTYGEDRLQSAEKYCHSTARQAAMVAKEAGVGKLLLGHYSSRYEDENVLLEEAKKVFDNTYLTNEMAVFDV